MAWESIEERLKYALTIEVPYEQGIVWFPSGSLEIDDWLTSIAQTDEELKELNLLRRIRFLQNRFPIEKLLQLEWNGPAARRTILAMYVGHRSYILFFDGFTYQVVGSLEPKDQAALYQVVIERALRNPRLIPIPPKRIMMNRPEFIPRSEVEDLQHHHESFPQLPLEKHQKQSYLANLLIGWVGNWIELPVLGYWHDDESLAEDDVDRKTAA
jgi:hypothetical protein